VAALVADLAALTTAVGAAVVGVLLPEERVGMWTDVDAGAGPAHRPGMPPTLNVDFNKSLRFMITP
jgi:hypothetical protein